MTFEELADLQSLAIALESARADVKRWSDPTWTMLDLLERERRRASGDDEHVGSSLAYEPIIDEADMAELRSKALERVNKRLEALEKRFADVSIVAHV